MNRYIILGTAGHIDHGKSALVRALTGTDPDRLKEEKERGITIDLGFADLAYADGLKVGIVDVPGHERLIKNMLAGAGGIDIVLMVIAADEGIMPQSREHLDICNLLKVKRGLIAVTKSDLVEEDWLELIQEDIKDFVKGTFLENAEMITLSSKTGHNIELLKEKIKDIALSVEPKSVSGIFRLPVDRIFTLKGFGTVVTGTAVSGSISLDKPVEILPRGIKTKVRGLQSHGEKLKTAYAGQRVAMNLQGISKDEIRRGDVITIPDRVKTTYVIDADLELLKDSSNTLKNRSLIHFHTGTSELTGRIIIYGEQELKPGEKAYCQFRFKAPITVMAGDRYIIRKFSPLLTIGGGEILDTSPKRRRKDDRAKDLEIFEKGELKEKLSLKILQGGLNGATPDELIGWIKAETPVIRNEVNSLVKDNLAIHCEGRILHKKVFDDFVQKVVSTLNAFHKDNPLKPGISKEALRAAFKGLDQRVFESLIHIIKEIVIEKDILRLNTFKISLSEDKKVLKERILKVLEQSEFQPPSKDELAKSISIKPQEANELLKIMATEKSLVRINDSMYIPMSNYTKMIDGLKNFFSSKNEMTVGEFRDILKTSRKYALPFLEYLDSNKITLRVGEVRKFLIKS
ncbi:MAG TPA: selenocysteine-specific translation elongation factor [Nitrospirae bacterium]|nr:selenocysteine-specific elongation factor [bacterium BMS3Abin06]HDH13686.1 selenocysteine-specific translation elongation factor [Nitrospirota bacterium]HDZ02727.1 selenocysteine-specific translation elongation factor [Nitrospirota bacterium]